jgi:hypothetical protein
MNYPRRQQYRRLSHAGGAAAGGSVALLLALLLASAGAISLAVLLVVTAVGFAFRTRHWLGLAARSRVGARSEDEVHRQLAALEHDGWQVRHSLRWRGPGDIDSVAIVPSGIAFPNRDQDDDLRPAAARPSAGPGRQPDRVGTSHTSPIERVAIGAFGRSTATTHEDWTTRLPPALVGLAV